MQLAESITYLRSGRVMRATGTVVESDRGLTKVKPTRPDWGMVWITRDEIEAGQEKPPIRPREKKDKPQDKPKRTRKPKPPVQPRWKQLVDHVRKSQALGAIYLDMADAAALADELEAAQTLFKTNHTTPCPI